MKILKLLFLCKRRPQGRDLIERPYGRFYHLPRILAERGHEVHVILLSYKTEDKCVTIQDSIHWTSVSFFKRGPFGYAQEAENIIKRINPDWIIGFSDIYYGILAQRLASRFGCKSLIDAYDNYESYLLWCFPLHWIWRLSLRKATEVTAAGPQHASMLSLSRRTEEGVKVVPMAADPDFYHIEKVKARDDLGLSIQKKLVRYCGSLYRSRDIELLFKIADRITSKFPDVEIVVSGRKEKGVKIPSNIRYLGYLPDHQVPKMLNSMDVLLVLNRETSFGKYSYPVKLYEAMQCQVPVVASATESIRWILDDNEQFLAKIGDVEDFSEKIIDCLALEKFSSQTTNTWEDVAERLSKNLLIDF